MPWHLLDSLPFFTERSPREEELGASTHTAFVSVVQTSSSGSQDGSNRHFRKYFVVMKEQIRNLASFGKIFLFQTFAQAPLF